MRRACRRLGRRHTITLVAGSDHHSALTAGHVPVESRLSARRAQRLWIGAEMTQSLEQSIRADFAANAGLPERWLVKQDPNLAEIIARSDRMNNSLDLMEAFVRTANQLKQARSIDIKLPMFAPDTRISAVLKAPLEQVPSADEPK